MPHRKVGREATGNRVKVKQPWHLKSVEFEQPWSEDGPLKHLGNEWDPDQLVVNHEHSLCMPFGEFTGGGENSKHELGFRGSGFKFRVSGCRQHPDISLILEIQ